MFRIRHITFEVKNLILFSTHFYWQGQYIFIGKVNTFMKYLLHRVIYVNTPPPTTTAKHLIRMSVHVIILPLIQPFKMPQETISSSTRIYKQSLLNSLKKETDAMLTHKHLKKKKKSEFKNSTALPYRSKIVQKFFLKAKTPKWSLQRTQTSKKSNAVFLQIFYKRA